MDLCGTGPSYLGTCWMGNFPLINWGWRKPPFIFILTNEHKVILSLLYFYSILNFFVGKI